MYLLDRDDPAVGPGAEQHSAHAATAELGVQTVGAYRTGGGGTQRLHQDGTALIASPATSVVSFSHLPDG